MIETLASDDFDLRLSAIEELSRTFGDNYGFFVDGSQAERMASLAQWQPVASRRHQETMPVHPKAGATESARDERRLWKHLRLVAQLPERDQRAVLRLIDTAARPAKAG